MNPHGLDPTKKIIRFVNLKSTVAMINPSAYRTTYYYYYRMAYAFRNGIVV